MPLIVRRTLLLALGLFALVGLPSFYLAHRPDHAAAILHSAADRLSPTLADSRVDVSGRVGDYHWDKGGLEPEPEFEDEQPRDSPPDADREPVDYGSHRRPGASQISEKLSNNRLESSRPASGNVWEDDEAEDATDDEATPDWLNESGRESGSGFGLNELLASDGEGDQEVIDLEGGVIMPKLGNETAKAELGRATWKFLHTLTLRYPLKPSASDRTALRSFFHLFARLYPCGDCASHFQQLLSKYPVQTAGRKEASLWLCSVHNEVNLSLGKPEFDCLTLDETYDCGCADDDAEQEAKLEPPDSAVDE